MLIYPEFDVRISNVLCRVSCMYMIAYQFKTTLLQAINVTQVICVITTCIRSFCYYSTFQL